MKCTKSLFAMFLHWINGLFLFIGLSCMLGTLYIYYLMHHAKFSAWIAPEWMIWIPFFIGIVTIWIAVTSCRATHKRKRFTLLVIALLQLLCCAVLLCFGSSILIYVGYSKDIAVAESFGDIVGGFANYREKMSDFETGLYARCCVLSSESVKKSIEANIYPTDCKDGEICVFDPSEFNEGYREGGDSDVCQALAYMHICKKGSLSATLTDLRAYNLQYHSYLRNFFYLGGGSIILFGCLMAIAAIGSSILAFDKHQTKMSSQVEFDDGSGSNFDRDIELVRERHLDRV